MLEKLFGSRARAAEGWNVIVIWECGLKGRECEKTLKKVEGWLKGAER